MYAMDNSKFSFSCTANTIKLAAQVLIDGNLVAFPTETVYGLGADACNADAVARIYSAKGRPADHPLIIHVVSMDALGDWADDVPGYAISLARDFWPGPMTLIVKRSKLAGDFVTGGQDTVGVRVPNHPVALGLLEAFARIGGKGVAAPSANRFGHVSPTTAKAVEEELGNYLDPIDQILDGGACEIGIESTIIDCTGDIPKILRPGAITVQMIAESTELSIAGKFVYTNDDLPRISINSEAVDTQTIRVSGSLANHYAPAANVLLDQVPESGQGFIALADVPTPEGVTRLAAPNSHEGFARLLYSALRAADEKGLETVVVQQPVGDGLAIAIRDRLKRAAHRNT